MRSSPEGDRKALWSRPQTRNLCATNKTIILEEIHQARNSRSSGHPPMLRHQPPIRRIAVPVIQQQRDPRVRLRANHPPDRLRHLLHSRQLSTFPLSCR